MVQPTAASLALIGYVVVSGLRSTALKGLQLQGASHPIGGDNPISFCNVFLISQLMIGLALISVEPKKVRRQLTQLPASAAPLIAADAFLGCFLAPLAFYLALEQLSVITQTLVFSLTLPASALIALWWLGERLPHRFNLSLLLILAGLLAGKVFGVMESSGPAGPMRMLDGLDGYLWAIVSVGATALRNSLRRRLAGLELCRGLSTGIPNLAGAVAFAIIALIRYGPWHFFYLSWWWVLGVIVVYGLTLCLGTEVLRQASQRHFQVSQIAFAGSASLVVTVLSAAWLLSEPLSWPILLSTGLILAGVLLRFLPSSLPPGGEHKALLLNP
ncbi:MAG: hypothetical protein NTW83_14370 [Cyanobacteria bacterium]|nr:hypothetical protein [Cyanobacteriota bacterium]